MLHPKIEGLRATLESLSAKDRPFAESLIQQYALKGRLSDKQWYWVVKLQLPRELKPEPVKLAATLDHLVKMFRSAREHLKWPKFTVQIGEQMDNYTFSLASDTSKNPGFLYVKRNGSYIGKVAPAGDFLPTRECRVEDTDNVFRFSQDPAKVAAEHGKLTGNCCFCSRKLTDDRSTEVGYGKICAGHYGLPWG